VAAAAVAVLSTAAIFTAAACRGATLLPRRTPVARTAAIGRSDEQCAGVQTPPHAPVIRRPRLVIRRRQHQRLQSVLSLSTPNVSTTTPNQSMLLITREFKTPNYAQRVSSNLRRRKAGVKCEMWERPYQTQTQHYARTKKAHPRSCITGTAEPSFCTVWI
jgi:hypothetical protein